MIFKGLVGSAPLGIDLRKVAAPPWEEDLLVTARPKGVVDV